LVSFLGRINGTILLPPSKEGGTRKKRTKIMGVNDLINEKLNDTRPGKAADTRAKFMLMLDEDTKTKLAQVSASLKTGKIELASELFQIAVNDAHAALSASGKLVTGETTGEKPKGKGKSKDEVPPVPPVPAE